MTNSYRLRVILHRPDREDAVAMCDVAVDAARGWAIYQEVVRRAVQPDAILMVPDGMTPEEAVRLRETWAESFVTERSG